MIHSRFNTAIGLLILCLLLPFIAAHAGGKHLEIMAPLSKQSDFKGKPHKVTETTYEASETTGQPRLESTEYSEYDKDGNPLRIETFDASNRKTDSEIYGYDAEGTWISLIEQSKNSPQKTLKIFLDQPGKRIARVDQRSKETEFYSYSQSGFELATALHTTAGRVIDKTTFKRNRADKEEHVLFEEPPGNKTTEISVTWTAQGFEESTTMTFHNRDRDKIVVTYEYPDVDPTGNWLTQIQKQVLHRANGETSPMPTETVKRTITYHP
jgi:hypothetical protein